MNKFTAILLLLFMLGLGSRAQAEETLKVVTTQAIFASLVEEIGESDVRVSYIASPKFNIHFIEPKPSDVLKVKRADLFVHAGLDLELWRGPLLDAAGNMQVKPGGSKELDVSEGVRLVEIPQGPLTRADGDIHVHGNPHYMLDPFNAKAVATSIARKLSELKPKHEKTYQKRLAGFLAQLDEKMRYWKSVCQKISGKEIVAYHNSWPYLAEFTGLKIKKFLEPKPGIPPNPRHIRFLETYMNEKNIRLIIQSTFYGRGSADLLAKRTGARVVLLCQNVGEIPECPDYFALMDYNITRLEEALTDENL